MLTELSNAVHSGAAFCIMQNAGRFTICGEDRLDFIQRQSTNDLRKLDLDPYVLTMLTSSVARIIDVLAVFRNGDCLDVITLPERGMATIGFLKGKIFFSDKVTIEDASTHSAHIRLIGNKAEEIARMVAEESPGPVNHFTFMDEQVIGFDKENLDDISSMIEAANGFRVDIPTYDVLRIEHGLPGYQNELTDQYTPLEVGLRELISEKKGCYTGQEVLARQINYDKITKQLFGIRLDSRVSVGDAVEVGGKRAGEVTSAGRSENHGWVALAVLRTAAASVGEKVSIGDTTGMVVDLPFHQA